MLALPSLPLTLLPSLSALLNSSLMSFVANFLLHVLALCKRIRKSDSREISILVSFFCESLTLCSLKESEMHHTDCQQRVVYVVELFVEEKRD